MPLESEHIWAIVLAGGQGTRLSALTTALYGHPVPKQFASFDGRRTMLESTLDRVARVVAPERTVVVVGPGQVAVARDLIALFDRCTLLAQPVAAGTAVAMLYGLAWIEATDPDACIVTFPSDHHVVDERGFADAAASAVTASCDLGRLVLLGATPTSNDPDYGWIVPGSKLGDRAWSIERFVEKPDQTTARTLRAEHALWNMFVSAAPASVLATLLGRFLPDQVVRFATWAHGSGPVGDAFRSIVPADFSRDVLQHANDLAVIPVADLGWSDWGTPERVVASLRGTATGRRLVARLEARGARRVDAR